MPFSIDKLSLLERSTTKIKPYFIPSHKNLLRTTALVTSFIIPVATNIIIGISISGNSNSTTTDNDEIHACNSNDSFDLLPTLTNIGIVSLFNGLRFGLSAFLVTSISLAMKEHYTELLMDTKSKFLMYGNKDSVSSLQYVTVGLGIRDFATNTIRLIVGIPVYALTSAATLVNIGVITESFITPAITLIFVGTSFWALYEVGDRYYLYQAENQKTENDLVGKVCFIEAHGEAMILMGSLDSEHNNLKKGFKEINSTIPKLFVLSGVYTLLNSLLTSVASDFLGGYYQNDYVPTLNTTKARVLNVMLMLFVSNMRFMVETLTFNHKYVELSLLEIEAFDKAYNDCLELQKNNMLYTFNGNQLLISGLSVYKPHNGSRDVNEEAVFDNLHIKLEPNKVYKLTGDSGSGKTTLLKAITNHWQFTEGSVTWPTNAQENICFIPQDTFIPRGTLLDAITYPLKPEEFIKANAQIIPNTRNGLTIDYMKNAFDEIDKLVVLKEEDINSLINRIAILLERVNLIPNVIKYDEILLPYINWDARFSGGEKQKIGIIRALLSESPFLIMDESVSALDLDNKKIMYNLIKDYFSNKEEYIILYTEHGLTEGFADNELVIHGASLDHVDMIM